MVNALLEKALLGMFAPFFGAKFLSTYRHFCSSNKLLHSAQSKLPNANFSADLK